MQALGLIETRGLLAAIESADAMLKAANVTLIEKTNVGGGLVTIAVTGDVGAVKAAVEAGAAAVEQLNAALLVSQHVIPRPHGELDDMIGQGRPAEDVKIQTSGSIEVEPDDEAAVEEAMDEETAVEDKRTTPMNENFEEINKNSVDTIVREHGLEAALEVLSNLRVTKLRNLAREYKELGITGRLISKADKKTLLAEFNEYYNITTKI